MARKREISFFTDIQSDEDFEKFLEQNKLLVLDVYQDLFGPCSSLQSTLERKKISLEDSDLLQLATCNADKIEKLKRFRFKSYPTIIFCRDEKVINISYGANIPQLLSMIDKYMNAIRNKVKDNNQQLYDFDELLPFEQAAIAEQLKAEQKRIEAEKEAERVEKFLMLDRIIELMNKNSSDMGITLFMPHCAKDAFRKTHETAKWLSLINRSERMIQLTPDMMETLNYNLDNKIPERILDEIYDKDVFAVLWYTDPRNPIISVLEEFIRRVTEPQEYEVEGEESIWETILDPLIIDLNEIAKNESADGASTAASTETENVEEIKEIERKSVKNEAIKQEEVENLRKSSVFRPRASSYAEAETDDLSIKSDPTKVTIPPVWTPNSRNGNAIWMYYLFRNQFESFLPPIIEPDPPHLCMIFPSKLRHQVLEVCEEYPKDLLNYGFFDGDDFDDFKPLCKTVDSFENLLTSGKEKMILKVSKRTSLLALDLVRLNPLYVSQNISDGEVECAMIFVEEISDEEEVL